MASSKKGWSFFTWVLIASLEILVIMLFVSADYMRTNTEVETQRLSRNSKARRRTLSKGRDRARPRRLAEASLHSN